MELTAAGRPFLYFPLATTSSRTSTSAHRLDRYRAGSRMDFDDRHAGGDREAIAEEIGREVDYVPVETDGARRAAGASPSSLTERAAGARGAGYSPPWPVRKLVCTVASAGERARR